MIMPNCTLHSQKEHPIVTGFSRLSREQMPTSHLDQHKSKLDRSVVIVEFRDEIYASVAGLLRQFGFITERVNSAADLAKKLNRNSPHLVLLSATQPDESAWLTCAKLRILDTSLMVWMYAPKAPSDLDQWASMSGINDVIVYGGVLQRLLDLLQDRLFPDVNPIKHSISDGKRRTVV